MRKEVITTVAAAAVVGIGAWVIRGTRDTLTELEAERVGRYLISNEDARASLLSAMDKDDKFQGPVGPTGKQGGPGPEGAQGPPGIDVPIGSIVAWPGPLPAEGSPWYERWRVCDGEPAPFDADLWKVLVGLYDNDDDPNKVGGEIELPRFEGRFLRGVGAGSKALGQPQMDQIQTHTHSHSFHQRSTTDGTNGSPNLEHLNSPDGWGGRAVMTTNRLNGARHGSETRPVNYAVHWVIRIK